MSMIDGVQLVWRAEGGTMRMPRTERRQPQRAALSARLLQPDGELGSDIGCTRADVDAMEGVQ